MKRIYLSLLPMLCIGLTATAQQFINGSLEPAGTIATCTAVPVATYNSNMGKAWIIGPASTVMNNNSSCSSGAAVAGSYYTGLKCTLSGPIPQNNKLIMKLDAPLTVGNTYKMTFSHKLDNGSSYVQTAGQLQYGYTHDSASVDSVSGLLFGFSNTSWTSMDTLKITPKITTQYIWLEAGFDGVAGTIMIYVDDFKMQPPTSVPGNLANAHSDIAVKLYPNPFTNKATMVLDEAATLPCRLSLYDLSGKELRKQTVTEKTYTIDRANLNNGIYFLQLTDMDNRKYNTKLVVE